MEIKISMREGRLSGAPRERPAVSIVGGTVRGSMILDLGWKRPALPGRILVCFVVCHVNGPIERQWDSAEHAAVQKLAIVSHPEMRSASPGAHEFQVLAIRDFVLSDGEGGGIHRVACELVIPAERAGMLPERRGACRNLDHSRLQFRSGRRFGR